MCGIICYASNQEKKTSIKKKLQVMQKTQFHRGPDSQKIYTIQNKNYSIGIGFQRLSIIDLNTRSDQPIITEDKRYYITFNGEIYNYLKLKKKFSKEIRDKIYGDSNLVKEAWKKWGKKCFKMFQGMWAILIYDKKLNEIIISRDYFGIKPLYYFNDGTNLVLSSEIKSILVSKVKKKFDLNYGATNNYLRQNILNYNKETFFKEITCLEANTIKTFKILKKKIIEKFSERVLSFPRIINKNIDNNIISIKKVISNSIRLHNVADVKVGILLSGGLDSSIIVSENAKINKKKLNTFSLVSKNKKISEEFYSNIVKNKFKTKHRKVSFDKLLINLKKLEKIIWFNDQPILSLSTASQYYLIRKAKKERIKVLLVGQGADEFFLGYKKYIFFFLIDLLKKKKIIKFFKYLYFFIRNSEIIKGFNIKDSARYILKKKTNLFSERFNIYKLENINFKNNFNKRILDDVYKYSLPSLLHYEDRMSMANSVELRVPFVDKEIFKMTNRIPNEQKFLEGFTKSLLKKSFKKDIPQNVVFRKIKYGYNVPEEDWIKKNKENIKKKYYNSEVFKNNIILRNNFFKMLDNKKKHNTKILLSTIFFLTWSHVFKNYIKY